MYILFVLTMHVLCSKHHYVITADIQEEAALLTLCVIGKSSCYDCWLFGFLLYIQGSLFCGSRESKCWSVTRKWHTTPHQLQSHLPFYYCCLLLLYEDYCSDTWCEEIFSSSIQALHVNPFTLSHNRKYWIAHWCEYFDLFCLAHFLSRHLLYRYRGWGI